LFERRTTFSDVEASDAELVGAVAARGRGPDELLRSLWSDETA
jgi:hypothetical protein